MKNPQKFNLETLYLTASKQNQSRYDKLGAIFSGGLFTGCTFVSEPTEDGSYIDFYIPSRRDYECCTPEHGKDIYGGSSRIQF